MKESLVFCYFFLVVWANVHLELPLLPCPRIYASHIRYHPRYQKCEHKLLVELAKSEGNAHVENTVSKQEVETKFCFVDICVKI